MKLASWSRDKIKSRARGLPLKYRVRVLALLNTQGERAATKEFILAWKIVSRGPSVPFHTQESKTGVVVPGGSDSTRLLGPSHPFISHGDSQDVMRDAQALLNRGCGVAKVARKFGLSKREVRSLRVSLHKKLGTVESCSPPTLPPDGLSKKQVHNYVVVVPPAASGDWQNALKREYVYNFGRNDGVEPFQDHFDLNPQVSIRATSQKLFITVKNVWLHDEGEQQARLIAMEAIRDLGIAYGWDWPETIQATFNGAEWALVGHELAKALAKEHARFYMVFNGKKIAYNDDTPGRSWEHTDVTRSRLSAQEEVTKVYMGFTSKEFARAIKAQSEASLLMAQSMTRYFEVKAEVAKARMPKAEIVPIERPDYFG